MTTELKFLFYAVLWGLFHIFLEIGASLYVQGFKWTFSSRDTGTPEFPGLFGRVVRSRKNFLETLPFFMAAVFMVQITSANNSTSLLGAQLYLVSRVIYLPLYLFGIPGLRTLAWMVSVGGILLILSVLI